MMISPPTRFAPMELSSAPGKGRFDAHVNASAHATESPSLLRAEAGVVYGLSEFAMVQFDAAYMNVDWVPDATRVDVQHIASARAGVAIAPDMKRQPLRITAGMGGGGSEAGPFFGTDIGFNLAFENPYVVPFFNYSFWWSIPQRDAQAGVTLGPAEPSPDEPPDPDLGAPVDVDRTVGMNYTIGLGFPLHHWPRMRDPSNPRAQSGRGWMLMVATHASDMQSKSASVASFGYSIGLRRRF